MKLLDRSGFPIEAGDRVYCPVLRREGKVVETRGQGVIMEVDGNHLHKLPRTLNLVQDRRQQQPLRPIGRSPYAPDRSHIELSEDGTFRVTHEDEEFSSLSRVEAARHLADRGLPPGVVENILDEVRLMDFSIRGGRKGLDHYLRLYG